MIVNEADLDAYLEHFGVKGMHWGKRKARTPEQTASRNKKLKVVGAGAVVVGAAATALILKHNGNIKAAKAVEAAAKFARENPVQGHNGRPPSPFEMQVMAGVAAQRNVMNRVANQQLTDKAWRDAANIARQNRAMQDSTVNLLGNTDEMMRQFNRNRG